MKNLFDAAMEGIGEKVALTAIRKVVRSNDNTQAKLEKIISIVETYQDYAHRQSMDAENRELQAEERAMRYGMGGDGE
jgi:hypothetical protein